MTIITPTELAFEYEFIKLLGEGANGKTWLAKSRQTGDLVAVKSLKLSGDMKQLELFVREAETLQSLDVPGIPRFYQSIIPENPLAKPCYIIQEYVEYPSLQSMMSEGNRFGEWEILNILKRLAQILDILQTQYVPPIIHRDIKPSNVLCDMKGDEVKALYLIDFGAVANPQKKSGGSTIAGTFGYMAPEQMLGEATIQSDFYSLGALAIHLLTGVPPFEIKADVFTLKFDDVIKRNAPYTSKSMFTLLHWLTEPSASKRPRTAKILIKALELTNGQIEFDPAVLNVNNVQEHLPKRSIFKKLSDYIKVHFPSWFGTGRVNDKWQNGTGIVHRMGKISVYPFKNNRPVLSSPKRNYPAVEYTYSINENTYEGSSIVPDELIGIITKKKMPFDVAILYDPQEPRFHQLLWEDMFEISDNDFVTSWRVIMANAVLELHIAILDDNSPVIDWGDGSRDRKLKHVYKEPGLYQVRILGGNIRWRWGNYKSISDFDNEDIISKVPRDIELVGVIQWGRVHLDSAAFAGCRLLGNEDFVWPPSDKIPVIHEAKGMFAYSRLFNGDISQWDVSHINDMPWMFYHASAFNGDLSQWNVSNVKDMCGVFNGATSFNGDLSQWNVSNVTNMYCMFEAATSFNGDLSKWDVSNVKDMSWMFYHATSFNGDLSQWNVSSVKDMSQMFSHASAFNGDLSQWDVSKVTNMVGMFSGATSYHGDISRWNLSSLEISDRNALVTYIH